MKRATVFLLMLACTVSASATVRVFVTSSDEPYGLDDRAISCMHAWTYPEGVDCDHFQVSSFPPADYPSGSCGNGTGLVCPGFCGEPFIGGYIWLQFQNEPAGAKINGVQVMISECDTWTPATCIYPTYYLMNNIANGGYKRWDGTGIPPDYTEWHDNPWVGVALTAHGIQNLPFSESCNLYDGAAHTALLGAIVCYPDEGHARDLRADITNISYASPPNPTVQGCAFSLFDRGDLNCDSAVDFGDINPFVLILTDPAGWQATYPGCPFSTGDINGDGAVDFADINPFVALFSGQ
jgi:hypothetical protein